eukprot:3630569-Heterocapsa_arctica.AAC.1
MLDHCTDHVMLSQEHWRLKEEIQSWGTLAHLKGWQGVWEPAKTTEVPGWDHWQIWRSSNSHMEWQTYVEKHFRSRLQSSRSINRMGKKGNASHFLDLWI